ncbi:MAG: ABC transporter ATP-binding protein [Candidatus Magasanikbacteria bacterium]|nr:ABC transporter ATP-binding protein [Candidatus Magasanikbacteria bacterium]
MLKITNLNAGYADLPVLKEVNLELQPATMSVLMGPNGAGKSTLLKSVFNLTNITSGQIYFEGVEITGWPAHKLLSLGIAYVAQGKINFSSMTVRENLMLGAHFIKNKMECQERLVKIYEQFPMLLEKEGALAFTLSGGQQQMLAIGRALMSAPRLLLLDEPSLGLAPKLVKEVFAKVRAIKDIFGATVLIVEHNLKSLMEVADYGYILVQGQIVAHDKCSILKNLPIMKDVFVGKLD